MPDLTPPTTPRNPTGARRTDRLGGPGRPLGGASSALTLAAAKPPVRKRLGLGTYSYVIHWKAARDGHPKARFKDTLGFLDYAHQLGAGGVQAALGVNDAGQARKLRDKAQTCGMYLEGQTSLPKAEPDVAGFDAEVRQAKAAGAEVIRTALLTGRRYEHFETAAAFRQFADQAWHSLTLAEPVVSKHRLRLAIENHKDWRGDELVDLLRRLSSEYVGACLDTGNNLALLEEPLALAEALAPFAFSTHLKDMAVQPYADGFLLSEVPLGQGFLDLKKLVTLLERANPRVQFNLEMITRDPLKVPCLSAKYWATMQAVPARELAAALALVHNHTARHPLPQTTGLDLEHQLALEDDHVRVSLTYAREQLGL
jgi:sugar phosphate isomerase/epimerase